jgi:methylmalonyl-CoA mutase cobalamin-binding subunit
MATEPETVVPIALYSEALDEIYALRRALAYEAMVVDAQALGVAALSKGRRAELEKATERMRDAARGRVTVTYSGTRATALQLAMEKSGCSNFLTRNQWETEPARRPRFIQ